MIHAMLRPDSRYPAAEFIAETIAQAIWHVRLYIDAFRLGPPQGWKAPIAASWPIR
jgi:hypothetical protein